MFLLLLQFLLLLLYVTVIIKKLLIAITFFKNKEQVNIMARFTMIKSFVFYFQQV